MKGIVVQVLRWAKDSVLEWLEGPEGRALLVQALRDLVARTDTEIDDKAVELVIQGLENIKEF